MALTSVVGELNSSELQVGMSEYLNYETETKVCVFDFDERVTVLTSFFTEPS